MNIERSILTELQPLLGRRLRDLRRQHRMTQEHVAEYMGITTKHMSELERGVTPPSLDLLCRLAAFYDSTPAALLMTAKEEENTLQEISRLLGRADEQTLQVIFKICAALVR